MSLVIRTGFGPITHEIVFNSNTIPKGKALAISHVVRVEDLRSGSISELIRGSVIPQTSVIATPYKIVLYVSTLQYEIKSK